MRKVVLVLVLVLSVNAFSQNKQVLYDFAGLPQTLLLNPGLETNLKFHIGLPLISGFSTEIGSTGFSVADIFADDGRDINDKIASVLQNIDSKDYLKINTQIEVFSAGYHFNDITYLSVGFYEELDFIFFLPKDVLTLATEGNITPLGRSFDFSHLNLNADFLGVIHAGITRKINKKLTVGGRLKIYSSAINVESVNNSGKFSTTITPDGDNTSISTLKDVNVTYRTTGINDVSGVSVLANTFLGGNLGLGGDVGFSYRITPQLKISGSFVDFGFINHSKNIENTTRIGNFETPGVNLQYDANDDYFDYWKQLNDNFKAAIPEEKNQNSYMAWRPSKLNAAVKYSFGETRSQYCYDRTFKETYTDAFGVQLYSLFRSLRNEYAFTGFYEKSLTTKVHAKLTYTVDNYSYNNIGLGVSTQFGNINFYGILDNVAELSDISSAKNVSLQFGFNLLFN
jgi:hypothetical protein